MIALVFWLVGITLTINLYTRRQLVLLIVTHSQEISPIVLMYI